MELVGKIAAAALFAALIVLLLRRSNPELAVPLSAVVCVFAFGAVLAVLQPVVELLVEAERMSGLSAVYFRPVIKCVAIGIISKAAADLCRDSAQSAMAGAVELGGTAAALLTALPLLRSFLQLLQGLL